MLVETNDILPDEELGMHVPGEALVEAIVKACKARGIDPADVGPLLELKPAYWRAILSGTKKIQGFGRQRMLLVAKFLGVSYVEAMALAELLVPGDFVVQGSLEKQLQATFDKLKRDPVWLVLAPPQRTWDITPQAVQVLVAHLYERMIGEELIAKAVVRGIIHVPVSETEEPQGLQKPQKPASRAKAQGGRKRASASNPKHKAAPGKRQTAG